MDTCTLLEERSFNEFVFVGGRLLKLTGIVPIELGEPSVYEGLLAGLEVGASDDSGKVAVVVI